MEDPAIRPALLIASLLLAGAAYGGVERTEQPPAPTQDGPRPAADCPRLFGTPAMQAANAKRREARVHWAEANDRLEIAHATQWKRPIPVTFPGVQLLEVTPSKAMLRIDDRFGELGCAAGDYVVRRDQALGKGNRVVALFRDVMVVEMGRKLAWAGTADAEAPRWRMIWGSPYYFRRPSTGKVTVSRGQRARANRRTPRARPRPNRRPRRR